MRGREGLSRADFYREDFGKWVKQMKVSQIYIEVCLSQGSQYSADA